MVVFTMIFGHFAKVPSDGVPYPVFSYTALLPWNLFSGGLNRCTLSLVGSANLITKVYFPRLIVPVSSVISGTIDFAISFVFLLGIMLWYHVVPSWGALALPIFFLLAVVTALAVGLWLSAINVRYRDVGQAIPFLMQVWTFLSPVAYPLSIVPEKWRLLYSLNPMVGVIEGFRWALLGKKSPDFLVIAVSIVVVLVVLLGGLFYFKRIERTFADVV
jgi:lipopolysaccharide transport system permease protein